MTLHTRSTSTPVELPEPPAMGFSAPVEVRAHLDQVEAARRRQLDALPATSLDVVAAAHRQCIERILDDVRAARARLDAGLYGTCARCTGPIPPDRLDLRPWATTCAACASRDRT